MNRTQTTRWMLVLATVVGLAGSAKAGIFTRTNTGTNLSGDTAAWSSSTVPSSSDIAAWDSTSALAGTSNLVNAAISWDGIKVTNITGALTIGNAGTNLLTIGASGIDLSSASADVTINNKLALGSNQDWKIANTRTFTALSASMAGSGTGNVNITNSSGTGTATVVFNANGNNASWSGYSGNITVNSNVKVQSQGNDAAAFGTGTITLAGGTISQNNGNWAWSNNINLTAASTIASDSGVSTGGRVMKLLGNLTGSYGLTFTNNNGSNDFTRDYCGFILAGSSASTYTTTTISANSRVRVGGDATASINSNPGTRGSLGSGNVTLSASTSELAFTWTDAHTVANNITGAGTVVIGGTYTNGSTVDMTKTSTQIVILSGSNTYTGATTIKAGTAKFAKEISLYNNTPASWTAANFTVYSGATAAFNVGGTGEFTSSDIDTLKGLSNVASGVTATQGFKNGSILGLDTTNASGGNFTYGSSIANHIAGATIDTLGLTKLGTGTLTLSGASTYTGGTTISAGTLAYGASGVLSDSGAVTVDGATAILSLGGNSDTVGAVALKNGGSITGTTGVLTGSGYAFESGSVSAILGGGVALTKTTTGTVTLSGANTYTGGTTISAGMLALGSSGALGPSGTISMNGGTLQFSAGNTADYTSGSRLKIEDGQTAIFDTNSQNVTFANALAVGTLGTGALSKAGSGTLTLSGANTYTGGTTISAGTLMLGNAAALPSGKALTMGGGTLNMNGYSATVGNLYGSAAGGTATITGSSTADTLTPSGFQVANTGSVTNTLNLTGGTLDASSSSIVSAVSWGGGSTGVLNISGGVTKIYQLSIAASGSGTGTLNLTGGTLNIGAGGIVASAATTGTRTVNLGEATVGSLAAWSSTLNMTLTGTTNGTNFDTTGGSISLSGILSGASAKLKKSGSGTLTLSGTNTYTGGTAISAGTLAFANGTLGTAGAITVNGGTLQWATGNTQDISSRLTMVAATTATLDTNGNNVTLGTAFGGGTTGALAKTGSGTLTLSGTNTYTGGTAISAGTLSFSSGALGSSGSVTVSGGTLQWASGNTQDISTRLVMVNGAAATLDTTGNVTLATAFGGGTSGILRKLGAGTLTLSGTNTYTGGTTIVAGTLAFANGSLGTTGAITLNGGTLRWATGNTEDISSRLALYTGSSGTLDTNGNNVTLATGFGASSTGALAKSGSGVLTLSGSNSYTGVTTLSAGTIRAGNNSALGTGTLKFDGGTFASDSATGRTLANALNFNTGTTINLGDATGTGVLIFNGTVALSGSGGARAISTSADVTFTGVVGGSSNASFTKSGAGKLSLLNTENTFNINTGANRMLFFTGGTVEVTKLANWDSNSSIGKSSDLASGTVVLDGAILSLIDPASPAASSTNRLLQIGQSTAGGTGTIQNNNALDANTLTFSNTGAIGYGTANQTRTLVLGGSNAGDNTFASLIGDNGTGLVSLTKAAAGKWILTGSNSYTGGTTVNAGTLKINNSNALGSSSGAVALNGGTLDLNGYAIANGITLNGGDLAGNGGTISGVIANGTASTLVVGSSLTLSASNSYTGGTTVNAGTLTLGNGHALGAGPATLNGGTLNVGALVVANDITLGGGTLSYTSDATLSGNISETGVRSLTVDNNLTLSGSNSYSGGTNLNSGTLVFANGALPSTGTITFGLAGSPVLKWGTGNTQAVTNAIDVGADYATFDPNGNDIALGGANSLYGTGGLLMSDSLGSGTLNLNKAGTYQGFTAIGSGTLKLGADNAIPQAASANSYLGVDGTLDMNGHGVSANVLGNSSGITTGLVTSGTAATLTLGCDKTLLDNISYDGRITGAVSLVKTGDNSQLLSGSNSYSGGTTVTAGTLTAGSAHAFGINSIAVNGGVLDLAGFGVANVIAVGASGKLVGASNQSLANVTFTDGAAMTGSFDSFNTGTDPLKAYNVTGGATYTALSGQGAFTGGLVTVTGAYAPGNSPGTQTFDTGLALSGATTLEIDSQGVNGTNGLPNDFINITGGGLDLSSGTATLNLNLYGTQDYTTTYWDVDHSFTLIHAGGGVTGSFASISLLGLGTDVTNGTWSAGWTGNDYIASWTAVVPEPGTLGLLVLGALALLGRRRGRK